MGVGKRTTRFIGCPLLIAVVTLLIGGCSKPEEVIRRRLAQANQNLEAGHVTEAVQALEKLNRSYVDQPQVLEALGFAYARAGEHAKAAASFERAADIDPRSGSLRQLAADSYSAAQMNNRAAQQYRLYLNEFPGDYTAWEKLGRIEEEDGNLVRANDAYLECYSLRPSGEVAWRIGSVFRRLNNAPQAKAWLETTVKHAGPHVEDALVGLLQLEFNARDFAAAERSLKQLDSIYPGAIARAGLAAVRDEIATWRTQQDGLNAARVAQRNTTRAFEEERRRREAELAAIRERPPAVRPPPPDAPAAADDEPTAGRPVPVATATEPTPAPPPTSTAEETASPAMPSSDTAESTPRPAASRDEDTAPAAAPATATAAVVAPPPTDAAAGLAPDLRAAESLRQRGRLQQAIDALWTIIANDDSRVDAWLLLGRYFRSQERWADAEACLLEARRRAPDDLEVLMEYLNVVRESQPREVYFARVGEARRRFPENPDLAYRFARELAALDGAAARAVSAYEDFLLLAPPDDPRRREASSYLARVRGY